MIQDIDKFENLEPDKARYVLAETKLKLMNLMSHLELLEAKLVERDRPSARVEGQILKQIESISNRNPAQQ